MPDIATLYNPAYDAWPELRTQTIILAPVRVGINKETGEVLMGWDHTVQSMQVIFSTRFHERVMRRYFGSFVPHLLGENAIDRVITRFFWAIASAIDLWEPNYSILRVTVGNSTTPEALRMGNFSFQNHGVYKPRGHLGDPTPESRKSVMGSNGILRTT